FSFYNNGTTHCVVAVTTHLVTRYLVHKVRVSSNFLHFLSCVQWSEPHGSNNTGYSIHFHTEVRKTHVMDYITRSDNKLYRFIYNQVYFTIFYNNIIFTCFVVPVKT